LRKLKENTQNIVYQIVTTLVAEENVKNKL